MFDYFLRLSLREIASVNFLRFFCRFGQKKPKALFAALSACTTRLQLAG
jgi:hypothetical protein